MDTDVPIPEPQEQKLACLVLVDTSSSMAGDKIQQLTEGLRLFEEEVWQDKRGRLIVDACLVAFDTSARVVRDFGPVDGLADHPLHADGGTSMGAGLRLGLDLVEERLRQYKREGVNRLRPWVFLITDGEANDMYRGDAQFNALRDRIHAGHKAGRFLFFAIGVDDADMDLLRDLAPPDWPPMKMRGHSFKEFFQWLSVNSIQASGSKPGDHLTLTDPTKGGHVWAELQL